MNHVIAPPRITVSSPERNKSAKRPAPHRLFNVSPQNSSFTIGFNYVLGTPARSADVRSGTRRGLFHRCNLRMSRNLSGRKDLGKSSWTSSRSGWTILSELRWTPTRRGEYDFSRKLPVAFTLGRPSCVGCAGDPAHSRLRHLIVLVLRLKSRT